MEDRNGKYTFRIVMVVSLMSKMKTMVLETSTGVASGGGVDWEGMLIMSWDEKKKNQDLSRRHVG